MQNRSKAIDYTPLSLMKNSVTKVIKKGKKGHILLFSVSN